ncbi:MAG: 50S ribosomal protein L4 [Bacilli bacterium]|jgi:large subunit ribosomal protein L4|nr:50S ribosomal protein L4 [Bacilli bacterium]
MANKKQAKVQEVNLNLPVLDYTGKKIGDVTLPSDLFAAKIKPYSVQRAVRVDLANRRVGTAHTLTRDIVHGSNRKPFAQKGTGRARQGTVNAPIHRHGGVVFAPNGQQNFRLSMNKSEHYIAFTSALSDKAMSNDIIVLTDEKFASTKTKDFVKALAAIKADENKNLLVLADIDMNLIKACRNLTNVIVTTSDNLSVYDILNAKKLILVKNTIPTEDDDACDHDHDVKEAK